jgi:hypothetical protein
MTNVGDPFRKIRHTQYALFCSATVLGTVGIHRRCDVAAGLAAWALIAAGLIEMIYRP